MQMMLNFIAYASPRLGTPLLREALSVPEKIGRHDDLNSLSIIREASITRLCRSLVRKSNDGFYYEFAHFSVLEFLEGEMMSKPEMDSLRVSRNICDSLLAKQCLNYLLFRNFSSLPAEKEEILEYTWKRDEQHPFYLYAAVHWPIFARDQWKEQALVKSAELLFQPAKTGNFVSWALEITSFFTPDRYKTFWVAGRRIDFERHPFREPILRLLPRLVDAKFTTLHMAATLSLPVICSSLIEKGASIDQRSCFGSPLQCALQGLFLAVPDDASWARDRAYDYGPGIFSRSRTNIFFHNQKGPPESIIANTVRLLLENGASHSDTCSSPFAGQTLITVALKVASIMQDLHAMTVFLEAGISVENEDLNEFDRFRSYLLSHRNHFGNYDIYHLRDLILSLGRIIDRSAAHLHLCQAAWSLAIEMGYEFARDTSFVDTRISSSQDSFTKTTLESIKHADIEMLTRSLKDPRAKMMREIDDESKFLIKNNFPLFDIVSHFDGLVVIKMLLSAGMKVNEPNLDGLLPIQELARCKLYDINGKSYKILCEIISEFIRKGTGCTVRSRANQNVFHLGLRSPDFIRALLAVETEHNILAALTTRDEKGYTPIALALQSGLEETALLLLRNSNCHLQALECPTSIHALCVAGGTHRAFNFLLNAGIGLNHADGSGATLLHHVGPKTRKEFVLQLIHMFPDGLRSRVGGKLPLNTYLESCIVGGSDGVDPDVIQMLAIFGSDGLRQREKKVVLQIFAKSIPTANRLKLASPESREQDFQVKEITAQAITCLLELGFFQAYEAAAHAPAVQLLLNPLLNSLDELWLIPSEAIYRVLEQTIFWKTLRTAAAILRLMKAAVTLSNVALVEMLLANGVNVHERIDGMSALEVACDKAFKSPDQEKVFRMLLDHADASRLDEINPNQGEGKGLIHYLTGYEKEWQLEELLKRGVNVNLRKTFNACPALVDHVYNISSNSAIILLENGADPTMADGTGMDAALTAAFLGNVAFLNHLYAAEGQDWQLNWRRTRTADFFADGLDFKVSKMNALHFAAWRGSCDAIRFYVDKGLLTSLDTTSMEELLTPMHLAALKGNAEAVILLYSLGASLNLKAADGSLPLHLAVRNGHAEVVRLLVKYGSVIGADIHGISPVGYAMQLQNQPILDCLQTTQQYLAYQSDPGSRKKDIAHAHEQALIRGDIEQCEKLNMRDRPVIIDLPRQNGRSALVLAIENSNEKLIDWLLDRGAKAAGETFNADAERISPLQAMVTRPALNNLLPRLLQRYHIEGGLVASEKPSLICIAIKNKNNLGLRLLLEHIARHETTNS